MKRHRPCGNCDCRDEGCSGIVQDTPICCDECPDKKSPCFYVARAGCDIFGEGGVCLMRTNDILKPICAIPDASGAPCTGCPESERCAWYGLGFDNYCTSDVFINALNSATLLYQWTSFGCTWMNSVQMFLDTPIFDLSQDVNQYGWGWKLKLSAGGAVYSRTGFGSYSVAAWDCDGPNTLTKTSGDDHLPLHVCITPFWAANTLPAGVTNADQLREAFWRCPPANTCIGTSVWETQASVGFGDFWALRSSTCEDGCSPAQPLINPDLTLYGTATAGYTTTCEAGETGQKRWLLASCPDGLLPDLSRYADNADRCACCDPGCSTLPTQPLWMKCAGCEDSTTVTPTIGESRGTDGANSNGNPTYWAEATLCTHLLQVGWYCDGADWWADIWVDNVFCESLNLGPPVSCCPLVIGTGSSDCTVDCCIGVGEECQLCCATNLPDGVPDEVTAQFTLLSGTCTAVDGTEQAIAIPGTTDVTLCANNKLSITTGLIACIPGADPDMLDLTTELFCDNVSQGTVHTVIPCSYFAATPFWTETKNTGATDCCCNGPISFTVDFVL